ncbi:agamous-like MADS-box protein AGL80 [Solanum dulcamara]|uniref:agamous-like MADS-box protein AGL80 n=1 Tax=Solanum dulcamara TaxID=45834 RepID=UPI0024862249|nr:agamous-like MADS-box protein AGL80 [Solanum dulcamara]
MPRNKVNFTLIEDESKRKVSYQKRQKGLFKKCEDLKKLCDVEVAAIVYGPYRNEPYIFPNNDAALTTFIKFKELPTLEKSKNMVTTQEFTEQRIKKLEEQLQKLRKENRVKKMTNEMYEVLSGKNISADMHPYDQNDLSRVIKKNLKEVRELMRKNVDGEGSTSNDSQPIVESMVTSRTNSGWPRDPSPLLFAQMFPPVGPQLLSPMPQQMAIRENPGMAPLTPSTIVDSMMPSPMMSPSMYSPVFHSTTQQMEPSTDIPSIGVATSMNNPSEDIPPIGVLTSMNNNLNNFDALSPSPTLSGLLNWNDDPDPIHSFCNFLSLGTPFEAISSAGCSFDFGYALGLLKSLRKHLSEFDSVVVTAGDLEVESFNMEDAEHA